MDHAHLPQEVVGPDGRAKMVTPSSCFLCFCNMKDDMANKIYATAIRPGLELKKKEQEQAEKLKALGKVKARKKKK